MQVKYEPLCYVSHQHPWLCHLLFHRHFKYFLFSFTVILGMILYLAGVITLLYEIDFTEYTYPLEIENINTIVDEIEFRHKRHGMNHIVNYSSIVSTINNFTDVKPLKQFENIDILIDLKKSCDQFWERDSLTKSVVKRDPNKGNVMVDALSKNYGVVDNIHLSSLNCVDHDKLDLDPIRILVVVKSAVNNYHRRQMIRHSWYINGPYDGQFSFRTIFMVGGCHERNYVPYDLGNSWTPEDCVHNIEMESSRNGDIIQGSFVDMYYNNTLKTYTTMRWINDNCGQADYILALDDDYFLETRNLLNYIKNVTIYSSLSTNHPNYTSVPQYEAKAGVENQHKDECKLNDTNLDEIRLMRLSSYRHLWAGFVRFYVEPMRHLTSKWYLSYEQYPFSKFPPFVSGGATLLSRRTIANFYYASYFTKSFIFDDVYIGLIAYKLNVAAMHNDKFMSPVEELLKNPLYTPPSTRIAVHDIDPEKLVSLWNERMESSRRDQESSSDHDKANRTSESMRKMTPKP